MTSNIKLCNACRWMNEYSQCANPAIPMLDLVNGRHHLFFCEVARSTDMLCGFDARLFEPKP